MARERGGVPVAGSPGAGAGVGFSWDGEVEEADVVRTTSSSSSAGASPAAPAPVPAGATAAAPAGGRASRLRQSVSGQPSPACSGGPAGPGGLTLGAALMLEAAAAPPSGTTSGSNGGDGQLPGWLDAAVDRIAENQARAEILARRG